MGELQKQQIKLCSMTDFVLEQRQEVENNAKNSIVTSYTKLLDNIFNYANFLKQPLTLGMFIPTDENGNILEEPKISCACCKVCTCSEEYHKKYEQAQSKVLFKGFEYSKGTLEFVSNRMGCIYPFPNVKNYTIENLIKYDLELTESAIKQLGL